MSRRYRGSVHGAGLLMVERVMLFSMLLRSHRGSRCRCARSSRDLEVGVLLRRPRRGRDTLLKVSPGCGRCVGGAVVAGGCEGTTGLSLLRRHLLEPGVLLVGGILLQHGCFVNRSQLQLSDAAPHAHHLGRRTQNLNHCDFFVSERRGGLAISNLDSIGFQLKYITTQESSSLCRLGIVRCGLTGRVIPVRPVTRGLCVCVCV